MLSTCTYVSPLNKNVFNICFFFYLSKIMPWPDIRKAVFFIHMDIREKVGELRRKIRLKGKLTNK